MKQYLMGVIAFGYFPLLYALAYYFSDTITYLTADPEESEEELAEVQMWQVRFYSNLYKQVKFWNCRVCHMVYSGMVSY